MSFIAGTRVTRATGGTISSITGYTVHIFATPGVSTFIPSGNGTIEVLVVGGGGGAGPGGSGAGGGGGGGAVIYNKFVNVTSGTSYPITVGAAGAPTGGISSCTFNNATITAYGGGAGVNIGAGTSSINASGGGGGGSGAGGGGGIGAGITGLGFPGGAGYFPASNIAGGGGGGAGSAGTPSGNGPAVPAPGGIGVSYSITGISSYYGAGGGGYVGAPNGGLTPTSYGRGGASPFSAIPATPGAVIIRYPS